VHLLRCNYAQKARTPGLPRRLPAGRHGFAMSVAAQANSKTVDEAASRL